MSAVVLKRSNLSWICLIGVLVFVATGCFRQRSQDNAVPYVAFGVGVTGYVQIGMTLNTVKEKVAHLEIATERGKRDGFWAMFRPRRTVGHVVTIPSLGAMFRVKDYTSQISEIEFNIASALSTNFFKGILPDGLTLTNAKPINRVEIVAALGEPTPLGTNSILESFKAGKSFSWQPAPNCEMIYYLTAGVYFSLSTGAVDRLIITAPFTNSVKQTVIHPPR